MQIASKCRLFNSHFFSIFPQSIKPKIPFSPKIPKNPQFSIYASSSRTFNSSSSSSSSASILARKVLFMAPGVEPEDIKEEMILPGSNIVVGPYAGDAKIKEVEFVKSSNKPKDCPKDERPEFAMLGRSNVGKSSLINALVKKKEVALTSKKPGKTQLINHFLVNKSWYIVDLPGYGFANASEAARMDWSSFTKGYFLNRDTLVSVLLLIDASVPPQKIDLDCANWLGRNTIPITFVFTKCDKMKGGKAKRPDQNIRDFQELIRQNYNHQPPWIMTSSVSGLGRDELLLHMSQLRNYWNNE
ncbi:GTP-binding protein At2g22870 [Solanum stenotomum]|uniref:GTP-binding protein At2g22870 n=1 Tax=Solanum stenotomum TaxID=172797 RepID=UPI0020D17400|nr:GTP-binding protein At2g22870 [Solanum stenotomum]XP_049408302.1 GTP-binding protein At2g22870 [Solanum stenotomum]XP_049408303.1 GTP-binding protein At2g22870 [Solanum stenotomum]